MTAASLTCPSPFGEPDLIFRHALQDLLQMGLRVAAVATRLAEVEGQAVEALAAAATDAARVVEQPNSLESAIEAGRIADASEAARDATATRIALITGSFERAARVVRRTVALARRIEDGRPLQQSAQIEAAARTPGATGRTPTATAMAPTSEQLCDDLTDRLDAAELGDEIGDRPTLQVLGEIDRDLALAALPGQGYDDSPWPAPEMSHPPVTGPARPQPVEPRDAPGWPSPPGSPEPET